MLAGTDTIFAPATAAGRAAIAVVRLSGPDAARARHGAGRRPPAAARRRAAAGSSTRRPANRSTTRSCCGFPAPASFTGEDVAELHLHGSRAVLAAIIAALSRLGLRLAEPGEFTRRAFQNGKLDLTQAEAIADLAAAETEAQRRQALRQLDGELGGLYRDWSQRLTRILAHLEAAIDFPDEDLPPAIEDRIVAETAALAGEIGRHLADGRRGERLRDGITVAIVGPPNAGKSSLLNRIARREAAITSPIAGTTRDIVEVAIDLAGYPVVLADTAGLRDSADPVEQEGLAPRPPPRRGRPRSASSSSTRATRPMPPAPRPGPAPTRSSSPTRSTCVALCRNRYGPREPVMPGLDPGIHDDDGAADCGKDVDTHGSGPWAEGPRTSPAMTRELASRQRPGGAFPISALTGEGLDPLLQPSPPASPKPTASKRRS